VVPVAVSQRAQDSSRAGLAARLALEIGTLSLDVDIAVGANEVVAILGPNGSGKTTFLKALAGLLPVSEGRVVLDGNVLEDPAAGIRIPTEQRPIGFVFQDYRLFPHLSALENVAFGLRCAGMPKSLARVRSLEWLDRVGLGPHTSSRPGSLSGGQAQRVALARALATDPRLLLLDEPLAALDAGARVDVRREIRRHLASFEGTRIIVTHDPLEAAALADRLVVIENGVVIQTGTPPEVSERPRSRYVAELVGQNLFRGRANGDVVDVHGGGRLVFPGSENGEVFAVVHPRAVALYRSRPDGTPRNLWEGTVKSMDLEGDRARVLVHGPLPIVAEVTPAALSALELVDAGRVWVAVKATEVTVYPA
jgi:molybdate transport system ATP-binding protein